MGGGDGQLFDAGRYRRGDAEFSAGEVISSRHPGYAEGSASWACWGGRFMRSPTAVWLRAGEGDRSSVVVVARNSRLNSVTAYFGLLDLGQPRPCDTLVVSTAGGGGWFGRRPDRELMGSRTVGLTGGPVKPSYAVRSSATMPRSITRSAVLRGSSASCPRGVDVCFDYTAERSVMPCCHCLPSARAS